MGSCLSPVLSNLYMEYFEKELLPSVVDFDLVWYRYVDDIFFILPDNLSIQDFFAQLNSYIFQFILMFSLYCRCYFIAEDGHVTETF